MFYCPIKRIYSERSVSATGGPAYGWKNVESVGERFLTTPGTTIGGKNTKYTK